MRRACITWEVLIGTAWWICQVADLPGSTCCRWWQVDLLKEEGEAFGFSHSHGKAVAGLQVRMLFGTHLFPMLRSSSPPKKARLSHVTSRNLIFERGNPPTAFWKGHEARIFQWCVGVTRCSSTVHEEHMELVKGPLPEPTVTNGRDLAAWHWWHRKLLWSKALSIRVTAIKTYNTPSSQYIMWRPICQHDLKEPFWGFPMLPAGVKSTNNQPKIH